MNDCRCLSPKVLYYAQKAVLHPTAPLFDQEAQSLKLRCVRALKRIFILCDHDRDGALSDVELNDFQVRCFSAPLQPTEISCMKRVVQKKMPGGVNDNGFTLTGFLLLYALFIDKGRLETAWAILRKFGYDNEIKLRDDFIPTAITRAPDQWALMTLLDPANSFANLVYIGYSGDFNSAFTITRKRTVDRKKQQTQKKCVPMLCFWSQRCWKDSIATIIPWKGTGKTLVLREILEGDVRSLLTNKESLAPCDVAVFVYDSCVEFSWQRAKGLLVQVATHGKNTGYEVPCLIVALMDNLYQSVVALLKSNRVSQDMGIEIPIPISVKGKDLKNIFCKVVHAAQQPHLSIPETEAVGAAVAVAGAAKHRFTQLGRRRPKFTPGQ